MANAFYDQFLEDLLSKVYDLTTDDIKCVLVDLADYTFSAAHANLSDVAAGAREATTANLIGKSVTAGAFDATNTVFTAATGDPCEAVIVYHDDGVGDSTRGLICFIDTASAGFPVTPNGGDINLNFGANIFQL